MLLPYLLLLLLSASLGNVAAAGQSVSPQQQQVLCAPDCLHNEFIVNLPLHTLPGCPPPPGTSLRLVYYAPRRNECSSQAHNSFTRLACTSTRIAFAYSISAAQSALKNRCNFLPFSNYPLSPLSLSPLSASHLLSSLLLSHFAGKWSAPLLSQLGIVNFISFSQFLLHNSPCL